jgi:hypothetical protein
MATDNIANVINIGDIVNIPCVITAIGASSQNGVPILGLTAKYNSPNATPLTIATAYATQVILDK